MHKVLNRKFWLRLSSGLVFSIVAFFALYTNGLIKFFFVAGIFLVACLEWYYLSKKTGYSFMFGLAGLLYLALSVFSFLLIPTYLAIVMLVSVVLSDTGAFLAGKKIGGPKLIPALSPQKTWAGFCGAILFPAILAGGMQGLVFIPDAPLSGIYNWSDDWSVVKFFVFIHKDAIFLTVIFMFGVLGMVSQAGDILMSAAKRAAGIKDTGFLIPGHGGVLDRIDAMLLTAPFFLFCLEILERMQ